MLTSVQKEVLQNLINLYNYSEGKSIKGEEIANAMNRNPGTIRNQMQALRSLGLVKGVPGPRGGYKPTIDAYHYLNISVTDFDSEVPIYKNGELLKDVSVARIEFTSILHPEECEAAIKLLGNIKVLDIGDKVRIGPTLVNKLSVSGTVVGRDDIENMILLETTIIRSIPKLMVRDIASTDLTVLDTEDDLMDSLNLFIERNIEGAPVLGEGLLVGILTLTDIAKSMTLKLDKPKVKDAMSRNIYTVSEFVMISDAIDIMYKEKIGRLIVIDDYDDPVGIVTRTDILDMIAD